MQIFVNNGQKRFIILTPGVKVIKVIFFVTDTPYKYSRVSILGMPSQPSLIIARKAGAFLHMWSIFYDVPLMNGLTRVKKLA